MDEAADAGVDVDAAGAGIDGQSSSSRNTLFQSSFLNFFYLFTAQPLGDEMDIDPVNDAATGSIVDYHTELDGDSSVFLCPSSN